MDKQIKKAADIFRTAAYAFEDSGCLKDPKLYQIRAEIDRLEKELLAVDRVYDRAQKLKEKVKM